MTANNPPDTKIALLGVGQMGTPMASRLISADFDVHLWNRSKGRLADLVALGAVESSTPASAVTDAHLVITMLPDGTAVDDVMRGADGALASMSSGTIWLQMGSIGVDWTERLRAAAAEVGVWFVDAPVSGSVTPATTGQLLILASGPEESREDANQVFKVLGRQTYWLGDAGAGTRAKLILNNWLVDLVEMVAETLHVSTALDLDPNVIVDILAAAPIGSPYAVDKARAMLEGDFESKFALKHAVKDAVLALDAAHDVGKRLPITASLISTWQRALADGAGDLDLSVVYRYVST